MDILRNPFFLWGLGLVIVIPFTIIALTEFLEYLQKKKHPLESVVALIRNVVLPLLALFMVLRTVIELDEASLEVRLIATLFWVVLTITIFRISNVLFRKQDDVSSWHDNIPQLAKRLPALTLILLILGHLIQNIWQLPLTEFATTIGIGSVAIGFALQDTLSNLASGLLLLLNRPFTEGEWIRIGDVEGCVQEVNWRYTLIETRNGDLVIMPNGTVFQDSFKNYSRPARQTRVVQTIDVAYANPPNKVKRMFLEAMAQTPGILAEPAPAVGVTGIDEPVMGYEVRYWIADFANKPAIHDSFMTRIWYIAQRHGLLFPNPTYDLYHYDGPTANMEAKITPKKLADKLRSIPIFAQLPEKSIDALAQNTQLLHYAQSEKILTIHESEEGFYALLSGAAAMILPDTASVEHTVRHLHQGDFFGETGLFGRPISPCTIIVEEDIELLLIQHAALVNIINQYPQFTAEFNVIINKRRLLVEQISNV